MTDSRSAPGSLESSIHAFVEGLHHAPWFSAPGEPLFRTVSLPAQDVLLLSSAVERALESEAISSVLAAGPERWTALRRQALADGLMVAAVLRRYETVLRPEELRWEEWNRNQGLKVQRCIDALETEVEGFGDVLDIGTLSAGVALSYLDFRFPKMRWAATHPKLANWHPVFTMRDSMTRTEPPAG